MFNLKRLLDGNRRIPLSIIITLLIALLILGFLLDVYIKDSETLNNNRRVQGLSTNIPQPTPNFDNEIISAINATRQKEGIDKLTENILLDESADKKVDDIFKKNYWNNDAPDGTTPWGFLSQSGYKYDYSGILLSKGFLPADSTVKGWMNSKYKDDVLASKYKDIGVASKKGSLLGEDTIIVVVYLASKSQQIDLVPSVAPKKVKPFVDPDPIEPCKGQSGDFVNVKRSECQKLYSDCGLGNNVYKVMLKTECDKVHAGGNTNNNSSNTTSNTYTPSSNTSNKVAVFISYYGYTIYCPSQNISAVQSISSTMESKKMEWAKNYNDCADTFRKTNSCYVTCTATDKSDWNICTSVYGYEGDKYTECTKEVSDNYGKCISGCPSANQACDGVYSEQKNLSSQIDNLCK